MKKFLHIFPIVLMITFIPEQAHAAGFLSVVLEFIIGLFKTSPLQQLSDYIIRIAEGVNDSASDMMRFGDMLLCSSLHGSAADWDIMGVVSFKVFAPSIFLSGSILYAIGFLIMILTSFYLFDAAFNLCISIVLLPLALALWPFGWTRDRLKTIIHSIVYYVGLFIFLPLGVLIAKELAFEAVRSAFAPEVFDFNAAYEQDQSDLIEEKLGVFCLPFLKVLLCYVVAMRIIPLMAQDFCKHFFSAPLAGTPISDRLTDVAKSIAKQGKKVGKYGKDVAKHSAGKGLENFGNKLGNNFIGRTIARYGKQTAKTR